MINIQWAAGGYFLKLNYPKTLFNACVCWIHPRLMNSIIWLVNFSNQEKLACFATKVLGQGQKSPNCKYVNNEHSVSCKLSARLPSKFQRKSRVVNSNSYTLKQWAMGDFHMKPLQKSLFKPWYSGECHLYLCWTRDPYLQFHPSFHNHIIFMISLSNTDQLELTLLNIILW